MGRRDASGMSGRRLLLANAAIIFIIAGSLFCLAFDREYWPFSPYPMYSEITEKGSVSGMRLYGVARGAPHREVSLFARSYPESRAYLEPFDRLRMGRALERLASRRDPETRRRLLERSLLDSLRRYEQLRRAGNHDGPRLQGMRMYDCHWRFDARARNADRPDSRTLIAEVKLPDD